MDDGYEIRRLERFFLFQLYKIKIGKDSIEDAIALMQATMDPKDVQHVKYEFGKWKKKKQKK